MKPGTRVVREKKPELQPWLAFRHLGTVLSHDDPRAWAGSIAFPESCPDPERVREHVAACREFIPDFDERVPVLWDFGKIYWEKRLKAVC